MLPSNPARLRRVGGLLREAGQHLWHFWQGQNGFPITPFGNDGAGGGSGNDGAESGLGNDGAGDGSGNDGGLARLRRVVGLLREAALRVSWLFVSQHGLEGIALCAA